MRACLLALYVNVCSSCKRMFCLQHVCNAMHAVSARYVIEALDEYSTYCACTRKGIKRNVGLQVVVNRYRCKYACVTLGRTGMGEDEDHLDPFSAAENVAHLVIDQVLMLLTLLDIWSRFLA